MTYIKAFKTNDGHVIAFDTDGAAAVDPPGWEKFQTSNLPQTLDEAVKRLTSIGVMFIDVGVEQMTSRSSTFLRLERTASSPNNRILNLIEDMLNMGYGAEPSKYTSAWWTTADWDTKVTQASPHHYVRHEQWPTNSWPFLSKHGSMGQSTKYPDPIVKLVQLKRKAASVGSPLVARVTSPYNTKGSIVIAFDNERDDFGAEFLCFHQNSQYKVRWNYLTEKPDPKKSEEFTFSSQDRSWTVRRWSAYSQAVCLFIVWLNLTTPKETLPLISIDSSYKPSGAFPDGQGLSTMEINDALATDIRANHFY